jgi:hypothetical protein
MYFRNWVPSGKDFACSLRTNWITANFSYLREENRMRVFENSVIKRIQGPMTGEIGGRKILYDVEDAAWGT